MARAHVVVDTIQSLAVQPAPTAAPGAAAPAPPLQITLEGGATAALDLTKPHAAVWRQILESRRRTRQAVYLEVDPATRFATTLLLPRAVQVAAVRPGGAGGDVEVELIVSHARHHLRRSHPEFQTLLRDLQEAERTKATVLVTDTLDDHDIIDVRALPGGLRVPQPAGAPGAPSPGGPPVTLQRAQELFQLVSNLSCAPLDADSPCIPFMYPDDGCWGRAHEMCRLMLGAGDQPQKVWIFGSPLHVVTANNPSCGVYWGWHVAPTLLVDAGAGPETYVIDPSMFPEPVPQATWAGVQGDPAPTLKPSDASVFYRDLSGTYVQYDPDYTQTNQVLQNYRQALMLRSATNGPPPYAVCKADVFVRDNLQDAGAEPLAGGGISLSPDINHFSHPLADPVATLGSAAARGADNLFEPIEFGQPNYLYVRLLNRGRGAAAVDVDVYYSLPSTLPTPSSWTLIGSLTTLPVVPGALKVAGPLVWDQVPQPGHYCFVAVIGNALDPKPNLSSVHTAEDFYALIREHNNVTWKNFDVQDVVPGSSKELSFAIQGWPRVAYRGDLELDLSSLPGVCEVKLKMLRRLANGATLAGLRKVDETEEHVILEATPGRVAAVRGMQLKASDHSHAALTVFFPPAVPDGGYQIAALEKIGGKEMGRVTQRLVIGRYPYVGNSSSLELHLSNCEWVQRMSARHRIAFRDTSTAVRRGYNGCRFCLPQLDNG